MSTCTDLPRGGDLIATSREKGSRRRGTDRRREVRGPGRRLTSRAFGIGPVARRLAQAALASSVALGAVTTTFAAFLVRCAGLTPQQVGLALTVAGATGLASSALAGRLCDRSGARPVAVRLTMLQALVTCAYVAVQGPHAYVALAALLAFTERGGAVARNTLVATALPVAERMSAKSRQRSLLNVGISVGAAGGVLALRVDTRAAYLTLLILAAVAVAVSGQRLAGVRADAPPSAGRTPTRVALRDRRFVSVSALCGVLMIQHSVFVVGVPLAIVSRRDFTPTVVPALILVNTAIVIGFQGRLSRGIQDLGDAASALRRAGLLLLSACVCFGVAFAASAGVSVAVLLLGVAVLSFGEILTAAALWSISFGLSAPGRQGEYQGIFALCTSAETIVGPLVVTQLTTGLGWAGWIALGAVFPVAAILVDVLLGRRAAAAEGMGP